MSSHIIEAAGVVIVPLIYQNEVADIEQWPRLVDLLSESWCVVADEAGRVFAGRRSQAGATDRSLKELGRAVGAAAREAFGVDGLRLVGPKRGARLCHKHAKAQRGAT